MSQTNLQYNNGNQQFVVMKIIGTSPFESSDALKGGMTVQSFDYTFDRMRNKTGLPYGAVNNTTFNVAVRVTDTTQVKEIFLLMKEMTKSDFLFMFNAQYNKDDGKFLSWEEAMSVNGVIVDIEEGFVSVAANEDQQMVVRFKILVSKAVYYGPYKRLFAGAVIESKELVIVS